LGVLASACHPSYEGGINRIVVEVGWAKKVKPYPPPKKKATAKKTGGMRAVPPRPKINK
jgi:hypothetical protein